MPTPKRLDPTLLDAVAADGGDNTVNLAVLKKGKKRKPKAMATWQVQLSQVNPERISGRQVTVKPEEIGKTYRIGTEYQRTIDEKHVRDLAFSFEVIPHFTSTLILCTKKGGPKNVFFAADGQHRLAALVPYGKARTFNAQVYEDCTPDEIRALFDANRGRKATAQDVLNAYRDASPAYQRYKRISDSFLPVKINLVKRPGQIRWIDVFSAYDVAERGILTRVGHSTNQCIARWTSNESIIALEVLLLLVRAIEIATYELNRQSPGKRSPAAVGNRLAKLLTPLKKSSPPAIRDQEARIEKVMGLVREAAATPSNRPNPGVYRENMLRILFTLRRHNDWKKILCRIPYMLNRLMPQDYKLTTHGDFEMLLEIVIKSMNKHAQGDDVLQWPGRTKLGALKGVS